MNQPLPLMLFLASQILIYGEAAKGQEPTTRPLLRFPGESVELAMPQKAGRSLVEVYVGDAGPYDFLIDTGASVSVVDTEIASELGLEVVGHLAVGAPGGEKVESDRVAVPLLRTGALEIMNAQPISLDISEMTGGIMKGVLGLDLFGEVLVTLDPSARRAIVSRGELAADEEGVVELTGPLGRIAFTMEVAGRAVPTHIDSGSPAGFTLPIELVDELPALDEPEQHASAGLVGGPRSVRIKRLDGVIRLGEMEFRNPRVGFMDPSPGSANIGAQILNDLVLTIDQKNRRLSVRQSMHSVQVSQPRAPRRLGVRFQGTGGTTFTRIASVDPGSLGEQAGFQAGDSLISLNGLPMTEYDTATLGELIRGSEALRWELERDGQRHLIEIHPQ